MTYSKREKHANYETFLERNEQESFIKEFWLFAKVKKLKPLYFNSLREEYRLQATDICITNANGTDPMSLVKYAIDLYKNSQKEGNDFDFVFCVFDKDDHANYKQAINEI